jgi:hypothetical protein
MEEVKEIAQLKRREQALENIQYYKGEILRRDASPYMLVIAAISGLIAAALVVSLFFRRS